MEDFESLLKYNASIERNQDKWFKSINDGNITIKEQIYTIKVTDNKRQLIYKNGTLVGTKPYVIDNNKIIK